MDGDSGDDGRDELRRLEWEELDEEWLGRGWRNEIGSNTKGRVMHNEMSSLWF